jgi:3-hydroxyacyl-CoA dehydrogenase/enoyl-CoA hydratase/3-hydroxybutyryl-CoA epimerase
MSAFTVTIEQGVALVSFDLAGEPVNKLNPAAVADFEQAFFPLADDLAVRAVVLLSAKEHNFIAGADIDQFLLIRSAEDGGAMAKAGQDLIARVEAFPKPVVAAIHGSCLGAGLELSLACAWRIATDHPKTQLGLPEVQIGILPGAGGCQRLPRTIGLRAALDIILAGKSERAAKALKIGLVDELVHPAMLRSAAIAAALRQAATAGRPSRPPKGGVMGLLLDRNPLGRRLVYRQARATVLRKTGGNYPAPLAAITAVRAGLEQGLATGFRVEREHFGALAVSEVARQLIRIFFATTALKKDDGVPAGTPARTVRRLGVVGAGFMGAGIAGTAALRAGVEARLKDADLPKVGKGLKAALGILDGQLARRRVTRYQHERLAGLLSGTADWTGFRRADLVIEAVFEDVDVKRGVLAELEAAVSADTVIATNTSTIPIARIGNALRHPERFLGMHYFSPVDRMPLLEVIPGPDTAPGAIATAVRFGRRMGKTVIVVADRPGFWVNRILSPYMNEAGRLLEEGVPVEVIDRAMTGFGFPVGPVTLLDEVGFDVATKAGGVMHAAFGDRLLPASTLGKLVADGRLGRKNGRGFYRYDDSRKGHVDESVYGLLGVKPLADVDRAMVRDRLSCMMLNEAAQAAVEGVVRSPRDGDIGAIFGIGYPAFRGGPLRTIDAMGAAALVKKLQDLALAFGERFTPCPAVVEMASSGTRFYPDGT